MTERGLPWILRAIHHQASQAPQRPAVTDDQETISYRELWERALDVARSLRTQTHPGDIVAVAAPRGTQFIGAALGCWLADTAYLPLDPAHPIDRLREIVADSGVQLAVLSAAQRGFGARLGIGETAVPTRARPAATLALPPLPASGAPAYVLYTSGSTGKPKGVVVGHDSLANLITWHLRAYRVTADDRALHTAGLGFDAAVWEIWPYLAAGATVVACPDDSRAIADFVAEEIVSHRCTMAFLATPMAEELLTLDASLPSLRFLLTGGDTLRLTRPVPGPYRLVNHYGPTEATVVTTAYTITDDALGTLPPIGSPITGAEVVVIGSDLRTVDDGEPGELYIGGLVVAIGYLNDSELTARQFVSLPGRGGRWYRTGDVVAWHRGVLEFRGRVDLEQLKVRGVRVASAEIETAILAQPGVLAAAVTVVGHGVDSALVAVVAVAGEPSADVLRRELRRVLPTAVVPTRFLFVPRVPLTPNGKLDRRAIATLAANLPG